MCTDENNLPAIRKPYTAAKVEQVTTVAVVAAAVKIWNEMIKNLNGIRKFE